MKRTCPSCGMDYEPSPENDNPEGICLECANEIGMVPMIQSVPDSPPVKKSFFQSQLESLINSESMENGSNTPDLILARYLVSCLNAFDAATRSRDDWYNSGEGIEENPRKGR